MCPWSVYTGSKVFADMYADILESVKLFPRN